MDINKIRKDFNVLDRKINGKPIIYLDNACMTLRPRQVVDAMNEYYLEYPACSGRSTHRLAREVTEKVEMSREKIKAFLGAKDASEIIFTKNTTEGLNLVANSLPLQRGDIVLTTDKEHNSNLMPWQIASRKKGIKHEIVESNDDNSFNIELFKSKMSKNVKLVSMVHTSNVDGYTIPAKDIIKIAHDFGALVMLDGAQSAPHQKINVRNLDVDFFALSAHKMSGPSGMGALFGKKDILEKMEPFIVGGDTVIDTTYNSYKLGPLPDKFEAGLQNYAGIIGFGAASDYITKIGIENIHSHEIKLNSIATELLKGHVNILGPENPALRGGIFSFHVKGISPHDIAMILDESANIMIRSGAHCVHSWFNKKKIEGSARASMYYYNTEDEIRIFAEKTLEAIKFFR